MTIQADREGSDASRWLVFPVSVALFAFPVTLFGWPRLANAAFSLLAATGLAFLIHDLATRDRRLASLLREYWPLVVAMGSLPLAVVFHRLVTDDWAAGISYLYLRFALFLPLVWILIIATDRSARPFHWGLATGAILSAIWLLSIDLDARPDRVGETNMIPFANLTLLMGVMALAAIARDTPVSIPWALGLSAGVSGLYASIASGTRGGWIAIPLLLVLALVAIRRTGRTVALGVLVMSLATLAALIAVSERLRTRVTTAIEGWRQFDSPGTADEPIGIRLELWHAAIEIFRANPLAGVGPRGFEPALLELHQQGRISEIASGYAHAHNDMLHALATLGIPGLLAVAATCMAPAWFFAGRIGIADPGIRAPAAIGLAQCCGMLVFGFTEAMFTITLTNAFHTLVVATCFAMVIAREQEAA
jgi:O-antigen ligase